MWVPTEGPMRILIADDNRQMAESLADLIAIELTADIELAEDGLDAVRKANANRPDAVILDVQMPGLDGVGAATMIRRHHAGHPPYFVALTGDAGSVHRLAEIDQAFDRVFAKPVDADQLVAALARLAAGPPAMPPAPARFDLAELLTRAARQAALGAGHLALSFDYRGPRVAVDGVALDVQCAAHRLLLGLVDMFAAGDVLFNADVVLDAAGGCAVALQAAGTGSLRSQDEVRDVLRRLALHDAADPTLPEARRALAMQATGPCPNTGVPIRFACDQVEGALLRATLVFARAEEVADSVPGPNGASAWVLGDGGVVDGILARRLERQGWQVQRFARIDDLLERLATLESASEVPALFIAREGVGIDQRATEVARRALPSSTVCVLAVAPGSATLDGRAPPPGYELRVEPISPHELAGFGDRGADRARARDDHTAPRVRSVGRPLVLLVDDNEINRIVGAGLIEALGYEVHTANDGIDAIDRCRQIAPDAVLMDLDMPVLDGIGATVRLRELQRLGELAPFVIVAATADATDDARLACERSGMDGYLTKPLRVAELRAQLARYVAV